jgi:N-acetyl-alpha-D-muramate 1-phosphate uridylyltransferase
VIQASLPTVCILAGGLGTRLGDVARARPKCLIEIAGRPFLDYQLELLASHGATKVVLCVGHLGDQVAARIGTHRYGVTVEYSYDAPGLDGTLGALRRASPLLGDRFLMLYGDTYLRIDYGRFAREWVASGLLGGMAVLHNQGSWDKSNAAFSQGHVVRYEKGAADPALGWIDYGLGGLDRKALGVVRDDERDLALLYRELASRGELFGFEATERFFEIGTPASLADTTTFLTRDLPSPLRGVLR